MSHRQASLISYVHKSILYVQIISVRHNRQQTGLFDRPGQADIVQSGRLVHDTLNVYYCGRVGKNW